MCMVDKTLPISLVIITYNEEKNIRRCLESAFGMVSEIVIVDSGSTDGTTRIASDYNAHVYHNPWPGHVAQKNIALSKCTQRWALSLDADEAMSIALRFSIENLFRRGEPDRSGYWINRKNFYLGEWIEHAWYPEWRLRMVKTNKALWVGSDPHDRLSVSGPTAKLTGDILHYSYADLQDHISRTISYGRIGAHTLVSRGQDFKWYKLVFSPLIRFAKSLILKQAWRDGWRGWIIAYSSLIACFVKYALVFEAKLNRESKADEEAEWKAPK